jgi:hypothetical protein
MATSDTRPFGSIFGEMIAHVQGIVGGEIRLAKAEVAHDLVLLKSTIVLLVVSVIFGLAGLGYTLLAIMFVVARALPMWAAALVVGLAALTVAVVCAMVGLANARKVRGTPRTTQSLKESLEWQS